MKIGKTGLVMLVLLSSFALGFYGTGIVSGQGESDPALHVGWQVVNETENFSHDQEHSEWVFGPQPNVWIGYAEGWVWNGTSIADNGFRVNANDQLLVNISIPWEFLSSASTLDAVGFWGVTQPHQRTAFGMEYNVTSGAWNSLSFNYVHEVDVPTGLGFLELFEDYCLYENNTVDGSYDLVFAIIFIEEVVNEILWTGLQAVDTLGRPISPSWLAKAEAGEYATPPIGLGIEVPRSDFALPSYYYAEVIDSAGDILHYVDVGDLFTFRLVSNEPLGDVMVQFSILSWDPDYGYHKPWAMKDQLWNFSSTETVRPYFPQVLFFVYNSTGAYAVPGYLDNIEWIWLDIVNQWTVSYDVVFNHTTDLSRFYSVADVSVSPTQQEITWTGSYTDYTDMHEDQYIEGETVKPEPYFWTVMSQDGRNLNPRQEIELKNTVQLSFKNAFIEANILNQYGDLAERAMPNDILNITFDVHAPKDIINGTYEIYAEATNLWVDEIGQNIDVDGIFVNRTLQNVTISFGGYGSGQNETHTWSYAVRHYFTVDFLGPFSGDFSIFVIQYRNLETGIAAPPEWFPLFDLADYLGYELTIGEDLTTGRIDFVLAADTPPAIYDDVTVEVGFFDDYFLNASLHTANDFNLYPMGSQTIKAPITTNILWSPHRLIVGNIPVWEQPLWSVTDEGALDLDGNEFTIDDQYYVKRTASWHDEGNTTLEGMVVGVEFDPTPGRIGDEFRSTSWMGVARTIMDYQASEVFYWYSASNGLPVGAAEMDEIRDTLWADEIVEIPAPGYEWIAWMSKNRTDIHTNIPGIESGEWSNTWFAWGTEQHYRVAATEQRQEWAGFRAKYAGLLLFNDGEGELDNGAPDFRLREGQVVTDEVTHFVLIDDIESLDLKRPLGSAADSGLETVSPETPVEFGITIYNVNVTIYPLRIRDSDGIRGAWDYRQSYEAVSSLTDADFDYWISTASVEKMSFDISFNVDMVNYDAEDPTRWNHAVAFKVDQVFGAWTLNEFDSRVLDNRSLAVNFFGILGTATRTTYQAEGAPIADTNGDSVSASYYQFGAENTPFANVTMGGLPYYWGDDGFTTEYTSGSSTAPIGAFSTMYESAAGETVTDWTVEASMLFMTAGYENWEGHEIRCDPVFVSYSSAFLSMQGNETTTTTTSPTTTPPPPSGDGISALYIMVGAMVALVVLVLVLARRR
ncbi:MAG: hypothetical protein ACFFEA_04740 [Candidatus Thorarchaeota archaeon]